MEELIKDFLEKNYHTEYYLFDYGIMIFEYTEDGKTYFRIKIGNSKAYKNIVVSLQELLSFLYQNTKPNIQKFQSPNTNL